jgi:low temperature requirement protein LtrA
VKTGLSLLYCGVRHGDVLRERPDSGHVEVTNTELFFDLVYVFAIIQLSEHLLGDLTLLGAAQSGVLFLGVWWAWNYTAWATGWLDPRSRGGVLVLASAMALSLAMAASIPDAFTHGHSRAPAFALAYVVLQCGRSAVMVWAFAGAGEPTMRRDHARLLAWSALAGVVWIVGAFVSSDDLRLAIWFAAALIDIGAPVHGFWLPGWGGTPMRDWSIAGAHFAERCQLVLMIAFGETVLRLGEAFADHGERAGVAITFVIGFLAILALWALYFLHQADRSAEEIHQAEDSAARMGRSAYTYGHMVMVGGLIVLAVAVHLAVLEPEAHVSFGFGCVSAGGTLLYLAGLSMSKVFLGHGAGWQPLLGAAVLIALTAALSGTDRQIELVALAAVSVGLWIWSGYNSAAHTRQS